MSQPDDTEAERAIVALENAADDLLRIGPARLADVWLESGGERISPIFRLADVAGNLFAMIGPIEAVYQNRQAAGATLEET